MQTQSEALPTRCAQKVRALPALDETSDWGEILPAGVFPPEVVGRLPYVVDASARVGGIVVDQNLNSKIQVADMLRVASVRRGMLACLSRSTWGLNAATLRTIGKSLLVTLAGCGYT